MTQHEMDKLKSLLRAQAAEASNTLHNRKGIIVRRTAEEFDQIAIAFERDIAVQHLDRESSLLRDILDALSRIENGTFGTCLHCDEEISQKRLAAVPWAPFCIASQDATDHHDPRVLQAAEDRFVQAA